MSTAAPRENQARGLLLILGVSTVLRLLAAASVPLLDDEAHYWVWARHLMWGYPDHPPMIAALVAATTSLFGDGVPVVRLAPVAFGTLSTLLVYALARTLFSPAAGLRAAVLFQALPAFAASGVMTAPDAPMGAFWLLAMLFGWQATRGTGWAWLAAGAAAGLAIQCKLAGGAIAVSLAGFVLASPSRRRWLRTPGPYLAVLVAAVILAPLAWWNIHHEWATFKRALVVDAWVHPTTVLGNVTTFVGSQFLYYAPLGFGLLAASLFALIAKARSDERFEFLFWCAAPTLAAVGLASLRALAKPHYTGPAYLAATVAAAGLWSMWRAQRLIRAAVVSSAALTLAALLVVSVPNPWSTNFRRDSLGWNVVALEVERVLPSLGPPGQTFVLAETYQAGSQLAYALRNRIPVLVPFRGFDLWAPPAAWLHRNGLYVDHLGGAPSSLAHAFERLGTPYVVSIRPGREVVLYPGTDFQGFAAR
jgi:4-amino-4-deoxy-L-arabinose transferase-like glycosyltransferase